MAIVVMGGILLGLSLPMGVKIALGVPLFLLQLKSEGGDFKRRCLKILLYLFLLVDLGVRIQMVNLNAFTGALVSVPPQVFLGYVSEVKAHHLTLWVQGERLSPYKVRLNVYEVDQALEGQWVSVKDWKPFLHDQLNQTGFNTVLYYKSYLIEGVLRVKNEAIEVVKPPTRGWGYKIPIIALGVNLRHWVHKRLLPLAGTSELWLKALLTGKLEENAGFVSAVKVLGVLHLCVISGFHYALVVGVIGRFAKCLSRDKRWIFLQEFFVALGLYRTVYEGFGSMRAMQTLLIKPVGLLCRRNTRGHQGWLLVCYWMLLQSPYRMYQIGFQVTVIATGGLLFMQAYIKALDHYPKLVKAGLTSAGVSFFVMPFLMWSFEAQPIFQALSTVLLSPLISVGLLFGLTWLVLGFGILEGPLKVGINYYFEAVDSVVRTLENLAFFQGELPAVTVYFWICCVLALLLFWSWPRGRYWFLRKPGGGLLALGVVLLVIGALGFLRVDFGLSVRTYALKDGEAYLIRAPGAVVLYDVGNDVALLGHLKRAGVTHIDLLIVSHPHQDHMGIVKEVCEAFEVTRIIEGVWPIEALRIGDLELKLGSPGDKALTDSNPNNQSIALMGRYRQACFLLTGDLESLGMAWLMSDFWQGEPVTLFKAPHHGSLFNNCSKILESLAPEFVWISGGRGKRVNKLPIYGELVTQKIPFYDTMVHGELYWGVSPFENAIGQ